MSGRRHSAWISKVGLLLVVAGVGFASDRGRPFITTGIVLCLAGLACILLSGWLTSRPRTRA